MLPPDLLVSLSEAHRRLTADAWQALANRLQAAAGSPNPGSIRSHTIGLANPDVLWTLSEAFHRHAAVTWVEIAAAMSAVAHLASRGSPLTEVIWTGPANGRFPVRRLDQVLYDLISTATRRIMLVTFAAHRVPHLGRHLANAVQRGVELSMILEREDESEGQLTRDAFAAFRGVLAPHTHLCYWPLDKRERNQAGRPGKLHAKCALIDDVALIGSANLTDDAFNLAASRYQTRSSIARHPASPEGTDRVMGPARTAA